MKVLIFSILCAAAVLRLSSSEKGVGSRIPERIKRCKYGDNGCMKNVMSYVFHKKFKGDRSIGLVRLDPLRVKNLEIEDDDIDITFQNLSITGLKDLHVIDVKGFQKDPTGRHKLQLRIEYLNLTGNYKINGNLRFIDLSGEGRGNISLANVEIVVAFNGKKFLKDEEEFIQPDNLILQIQQDGGSAHFDNLFEGNKKKTDSFNCFINDNFNDIFECLEDPISEALASIATKIVRRVFDKIQYRDLFVEE